MVSVVIPAFNEEKTVGAAVCAVIGHPAVGEVVVVDDGSDDATAQRAREAGARVVALSSNIGKAGAMDAGVAVASRNVILFLDADCYGFTHESVSRIITPVLEGRNIMYVGINTRKTFWLNKILRFFPILSGSRAVRRELWDAVPQEYKKRFQIEIALNYFSRGFTAESGFELVHGIRHVIKEKKHGVVAGTVRRLGMIRDILVIAVQLYVVRETKLFFAKMRPGALSE
ncbi:MAG TPA: glycosyltransferase [Candidatus Paceibacterota bacterium]|nr:glycosyltransferase [Candidatus Paceibacterota bacterium]